MINKERLKSFLRYSAYIYFAIIVIVSISFYFVFDILKRPKYSEQINVFVSSGNVNVTKLEEKLYAGYEDSFIKCVNVDFANKSDRQFSIIFNTRGLTNTEFIIMDDSYVESGKYSTYFTAIDEEIAKQLLNNNIEFYKDQDNHSYGIKVNDYLKDYVNVEDGNYYLFINKKSDKISTFNSFGTNDGLKVLQNIFR